MTTSRRLLSYSTSMLLASALPLGACSDEPVEPLGESVAALVGGTETDERPEVGKVWVGGNYCTGTLVGPRHVLTAGHCVDYSRTVHFGDQFTFDDATGENRAVLVQSIHPFSTSFNEDSLAGGEFNTDVALLTLAAEIPADQATPARLSGVRTLDRDVVTQFGYGCNQRDPRSGVGTKRYITFHGWNGSASCPGDSGGPVFFGEFDDASGPLWGIASGHSFETGDKYGDAAAYKVQVEELMADSNGMHVGFDRPGADLTSLITGSVSECQDQCTFRSACRSFTFRKSDGRCHLKSAVPDLVPHSGLIAGVAPLYEQGWDRPGGDYKTFIVTEGLPEVCAAACGNDSTCQSFTYRSSDRMCWLKNTRPTVVACNNCVSGAMARARNAGYERAGHDLRNLTANNDWECERACAKDVRCGAFVYQPWAKRCFLKDGAPHVGNAESVVSGAKRGLEVDTDRVGGDYRNFGTWDTQPEVCQATCARESECEAWTYKPPTIGAAKARCFLKSSITQRTSQAGYVSGVKGIEFHP